MVLVGGARGGDCGAQWWSLWCSVVELVLVPVVLSGGPMVLGGGSSMVELIVLVGGARDGAR